MKAIIMLCLINTIFSYAPWQYNGTTPDIESIVKGRCSVYKVIDADNKDPELQIKFDCNTFWDTFSSVFKNKNPCKTNFTGAYGEILKFIDNGESITDKTMFWSGTREVVHDFTHVNSNYRTLEDTFPGYFADSLRWCGCDNNCSADGIDYTLCDKKCDATTEFWGKASKQFAEKANGTAYVMVNGTQNGTFTAYWRGSYFGKEELPTMGRMKKVKVLNVYVINNLDQTPKEGCGKGTVAQLVDDATTYGIPKINCYDEPLLVQNILCAKYPSANECQPIAKENVESWKDATIALIAVAIVLLLTVIVLMVMYNRRRASSDFDYRNKVES